MKIRLFLMLVLTTLCGTQLHAQVACSSLNGCVLVYPDCGVVGMSNERWFTATSQCPGGKKQSVTGAYWTDVRRGAVSWPEYEIEWRGSCVPTTTPDSQLVPALVDAQAIFALAGSVHDCDGCPPDPPEIQNQHEMAVARFAAELGLGRHLILVEQAGVLGAVYDGLGTRWSFSQLVQALEGRGFRAESDYEVWPLHHSHELWVSGRNAGFAVVGQAALFEGNAGTLAIAIGEFGAGDGLLPQRRPVLGVATSRGITWSADAVLGLLVRSGITIE